MASELKTTNKQKKNLKKQNEEKWLPKAERWQSRGEVGKSVRTVSYKMN